MTISDSSLITVYNSGQFDAFPGITTYGPNNSYLLVTFMHSAQGDANTDGLTQYATSLDGGQTWSAPATVFTPPTNFHAQDTNVMTLRRNGNLVLTGFIESNSGSPTQGQPFVIIGTWSGSTITWGSPTYLGAAFPSTPNGFGFSTDKALELQNGNLLLTVYALQNGATNYSTGVYRGTWNGSGFTWSSSATLIAAGTASEQYNETGITQLPNGTILAMIRHDVSATATGYSQSTSTNNGATWSALTQTLAFSAPFRPAVTVTSTGVVVFSAAGTSDNTTVWTSSDGGNTWSSPLQVGGYSEYTSMVYLGNGTIAMASGIATTPNLVAAVYLNFLFTGFSGSQVSIAYVQSAFGGTTGAQTSTIAYGSPNTAGNLLVLAGRCFDSSSPFWPPTITDSQGNKWTVLKNISLNSGQVTVFIAYAANAKAGANTVTVKAASGTFTQAALIVAEYSGVSAFPVDTVVDYATGTGTTLTCNSITPASAHELLIIMGANETITNPGYTPQAGFTIRQAGNNPFIADNVNGSGGSQAFTVTIGSSVTWEGMAVAFVFVPPTPPLSTGNLVSLGLITVASAGTPVPVSAASLNCNQVYFSTVRGSQTGQQMYVGTAGMNKSTLAGVEHILQKPTATAADSWLLRPLKGGEALIDLSAVYIDADTSGDALLVSCLI